MQATLMQVPPTLSRSTMTTLSPALARSIARDLPALPPPTTSRSTSSAGSAGPVGAAGTGAAAGVWA